MAAPSSLHTSAMYLPSISATPRIWGCGAPGRRRKWRHTSICTRARERELSVTGTRAQPRPWRRLSSRSLAKFGARSTGRSCCYACISAALRRPIDSLHSCLHGVEAHAWHVANGSTAQRSQPWSAPSGCIPFTAVTAHVNAFDLPEANWVQASKPAASTARHALAGTLVCARCLQAGICFRAPVVCMPTHAPLLCTAHVACQDVDGSNLASSLRLFA